MTGTDLFNSAEALRTAERIVIKIGSSLLVDSATEQLRTSWLTALADDIAALHKAGKEIVIVSSGAIALGRRALNLHTGSLKLEESQAAAAAGQIRLAHAYETALSPHNIRVAQILLTLSDTEQRRRYLNARSTLDTLLDAHAIPVVNENDTIATSEIRFGDNDRLAARVAQMISADCLILLSDIDGLYTADPNADPNAEPVPVVDDITAEIEAMAGTVSPKDAARMGSGGMVTKLLAAKICLNAGCHMVIASGHVDHPIKALDAGARCTWFRARNNALAARKQWIAGSLSPLGTLVVDDGAARALQAGKSLLPAGVITVNGSFSRGDPVVVETNAGREIARGLCAYSSVDANKIKGCKSHQIEEILGYAGRSAMIHVDDLALTPKSNGTNSEKKPEN